MTNAGAAVELRGVTKRYGGRIANRTISLVVRPATIHALIGENGAGKSTLMKVLAGLVEPEEGEVWLHGQRLARGDPAAAIRQGLGMVHQHFMLVPELTVAENLVLGQEPRRGPWLDLARACRAIRAIGARHGLAVDPAARVADLSVGERQRAEIVRLLLRGADVLVLDEPTAVLAPAEVNELLRLLRTLASEGRTVLFVSHKLDEVLRAADRITVLRRGEVVLETTPGETSPAALARAMVGREVALETVEPERAPVVPVGQDGGQRRPALSVHELEVRRADGALAVRGVSLMVGEREIVGVAGIEGNGQSELALALAGLLPIRAGQVELGGRDITHASPAVRRSLGLAHLPEDRQLRGLVLGLSVAENLALGRERRAGAIGPWLLQRPLHRAALPLLDRFGVEPREPQAIVGALSGGNQQKIAMARALAEPPLLLIAAQPTRGVDVGAMAALWAELRRARDLGAGILLFSSEIAELRRLSDRLLVMARGRIVAERSVAATAEELGLLMTGALA